MLRQPRKDDRACIHVRSMIRVQPPIDSSMLDANIRSIIRARRLSCRRDISGRFDDHMPRTCRRQLGLVSLVDSHPSSISYAQCHRSYKSQFSPITTHPFSGWPAPLPYSALQGFHLLRNSRQGDSGQNSAQNRLLYRLKFSPVRPVANATPPTRSSGVDVATISLVWFWSPVFPSGADRIETRVIESAALDRCLCAREPPGLSTNGPGVFLNRVCASTQNPRLSSLSTGRECLSDTRDGAKHARCPPGPTRCNSKARTPPKNSPHAAH